MNPQRLHITAGGEIRELPGPLTIAQVREKIEAHTLDTVQIRRATRLIRGTIGVDPPQSIELYAGWVMFVDDNAYANHRHINHLATQIYHSQCRPGTSHVICGSVVLVPDSDF